VAFDVRKPDIPLPDWWLIAGWAAVSVHGGEYHGRTTPNGHHYRFTGISTPRGMGYRIDTIGVADYNYIFYGYTVEELYITQGREITVSGEFRHDDVLGGLAPDRRKTWAYLFDSEFNLLQSELLLDYYEWPNWYTKQVSFTGLDKGYYRVGIGRKDAWIAPYQLAAEWYGVTISIS